LATECMAARMLSLLSSDATMTIASSPTTMLTVGSPLLDIVLCSSLSATAEDRGDSQGGLYGGLKLDGGLRAD
jgi:hypothetical protein